jgi:outer membrane protein OmpA-like peptidoglycan-associated protein
MKKSVITLAAALALAAPMAALAQQDPNQAPVVIPDQQPEQPVKKKKKHQSEQPAEQAQQPDQQGEQPVKKRKKQPQEQAQPEMQQQSVEPEQPVKKRKKQQFEQPQEQAQPEMQQQQVVEPEQPVKKRKKQQFEQPQEQAQPEMQQQQSVEPEQPVKKRKKQQFEQPAEQAQPEMQQQQSVEPEQPVKKRKKQPTETTEQPVEPTQPAPSETTGQPQPEQSASGKAPPEVTQYLSDTRSPKELTDQELVSRVRNGRNLVRMKGLPDNVRQQLADEFKKARAEAMARDQAKATGKLPEPGQESTGQPAGEATTGKGNQIPLQSEGQPVQPTDQAAQPNPDKKQVQQLDGNKAVPEAEAKAKVYLNDSRPADQLKDDELRARLDSVRDLLASNQLSGDTERALRRRLRDEKEILRSRVAEKVVVEEKKGDVIPGRERRRDRNDDRKWDSWAENDVLRDRRRSDELEEGELRRRIDVYRVAIYDDRYDDQERAYWRDMMDRDRLYLRDRLMEDRRDRENYWHDRRDRNEINIDININLGPDREPPESAFMDEIDDEELEDYLVAAPRRKIPRRYTVAEIEEEPDVRTAMPAIEIDSIHFGFNESFVREEEVEKLDRIAEVIEKILAAHPREVFMIAGYTDAVGSDEYNLKLSRERAAAVKKALTTYYVIPARNLVTAGYGERYLKIPTADAEEENRRVSLQRVTPLVGEAEETE